MTVQAASARLKTWALTGLTGGNLGIDYITAPSVFPCLLQMFSQGAAALEEYSLSNAGLAAFPLDHCLLMWPAGFLPAAADRVLVLTMIDRYLNKLAADALLNNEVALPLVLYAAETDIVEIYGMLFFGVRFRHRLMVTVA